VRILQVISSFPPAYAYGGPAKVAYEISKELVKKGHEVTVYTTDVHDAHSRFKYDNNPMWVNGIEIYHFKNASNELAHRNLAAAPMIALALNRNIRNFNVVHLHEYRSFQAIFVHHYAKKYGVPYILQARGSIPRFKTKKELKKLFDIFFGYRLLKDASKLIFSTKMELKKCEEDFNIDKNKIVIVPNGIDLSEYSNLPEKREFRRKYSMRDDEKMILYVGRIHEIKGLDTLVKAFADLVKELDNVKLVIVGPDDGYTSTLKEIVTGLKIDDKVLFAGPIYEKDKLKAYVDADVFVLPSTYESFGNVALEACACGTPVIVTNRCGIADVVVDKVGYVVEYDKDQLRETIIKVLSDEEMRRRFREDGRRLVGDEFGWDKVVLDVEKIYLSVIEQ